MSARRRISWLILSLGVVGLAAPLRANAAEEIDRILFVPAVSTAPAQPGDVPELAFLTESSCFTITCVSDDQCSRICGAEALCVLQIPGGTKRCLVIDY